MKASELKSKSVEELTALAGELRSKLFNLNFDATDKKVKDPSHVVKTKRDIARVLTILREKK